MAGKITTLYIDTSSLRLVVSRGKRILDWAYLPLEREMVSDNMAVNESDLALKIEQLLKAHKSQSKNVFVGLSGLHCISRPMTLPRLPRDMLGEAVKQEARRVLPVPLEELYLSWREIPGSSERSQVFVVALPTVTVDSVVKTLHRAGRKPTFLGTKPLFLARSANEANAIIVDVQLTEFDIIVMANGIPQTVRTITFSDDGLSPDKKVGTIVNELTRTISFYNANNDESQLAPDVPIIASGELAEGLGLYQNFSAFDEHPVLPLQLPLDYPEGFNPNLYSANLGLILHHLRKKHKDESSFMVQNSLPMQYLPQPVSPVNVLGIPSAVFAIILLAFLVMNNLTVVGKIDALSARADNTRLALQDRLSRSQEISGEIKKLKTDISQVGVSIDNCRLVIDYMRDQRSRIDGDLSEIVKILPASITLENIHHNSTTLQLDGIASSEKDILLYITKLEDSRLFGGIVITNMAKNEDGSQDFTLLINTSEPIGEASGIDVILRYFPADVSLTTLRQTGDTTVIEANAPDEESIVLFLKELEESGLFQEIALNSKTSGADGGIDFAFTVRGIE